MFQKKRSKNSYKKKVRISYCFMNDYHISKIINLFVYVLNFKTTCFNFHRCNEFLLFMDVKEFLIFIMIEVHIYILKQFSFHSRFSSSIQA